MALVFKTWSISFVNWVRASMKLPRLRATSIYAGNRIVRRCAEAGQGPDEAVRHLHQGEAFVATLDYETAREWATQFGWDIFSRDPADTVAFRTVIRSLARASNPPWSELLPLGRAKVLGALDEDTLQCFRIAELDGMQSAALEWWNDMTAWARSRLSDKLAEYGRAAELKTLERERTYLAGTGQDPIWVALDDSTAGYDILSWRSVAAAEEPWRAQLIEVKSSVAGEAIHLSRGEWRLAEDRASQWELQVWIGQRPEPHVLRVDQLRPHIPVNVGNGRWESVLIPLDPLMDLAREGIKLAAGSGVEAAE
jgi:hypothetical protein